MILLASKIIRKFAFETIEINQETRMRPFLRWAGGKSRLLPQIISRLPERANNYFEPFLGCGALFFSLLPDQNHSFLSDINSDLVNCFNIIRTNPKEFYEILSGYEYSRDYYYTLRSMDRLNQIEKAARFYFLNRTCWNGLYRVNKKGEFNVPMGKFNKTPTFMKFDKIKEISKTLENVSLKCCDFSDAVDACKEGDFVYFDPPYITGHKNNGFAQYNNRVFSWEDQKRLAKISIKLKENGIKVMISNANHDSIKNLYINDFNINIVNRANTINSNVNNRGLVDEIIITSYGA